jgi:hypothetical protein
MSIRVFYGPGNHLTGSAYGSTCVRIYIYTREQTRLKILITLSAGCKRDRAYNASRDIFAAWRRRYPRSLRLLISNAISAALFAK